MWELPQKALIDHLGVERLHTVIGGSVGGMQALQWAALYPEMTRSVIPIAKGSRIHPRKVVFPW